MRAELEIALSRILRPLVRLMLGRSIRHPEVAEYMKQLFVDQAARHFAIDGKRLTDSRLSVLTGLQRRDVKRLREVATLETARTMGPLPRVLLRWATDPDWRDVSGHPLVLERRGPGRTFETLVAEVSRDIHPRTVLDALITDGHVELTPGSQTLRLLESAYLPRSDEGRMTYLATNLGDHAEAAVANVERSPDGGPFFERAAHFNRLSAASVRELAQLSRELQSSTLEAIARRAAELQHDDRADSGATHRFRCGAYVYHVDEANDATELREQDTE